MGSKRMIGRKKRKPAQKRYTDEKRWLKNADKKVKREKKRQDKLHKEDK